MANARPASCHLVPRIDGTEKDAWPNVPPKNPLNWAPVPNRLKSTSLNPANGNGTEMLGSMIVPNATVRMRSALPARTRREFSGSRFPGSRFVGSWFDGVEGFDGVD